MPGGGSVRKRMSRLGHKQTWRFRFQDIGANVFGFDPGSAEIFAQRMCLQGAFDESFPNSSNDCIYADLVLGCGD
jgi:hypothetical protein